MKLKINTCDGIFDTVDIRFTKKCDNSCSFCIEKFSGVPGSFTNITAIYNSVLQSCTNEVLILGGEPFLEITKLKELVEKLYYKDIRIYITTSLPKTIIDNWLIFSDIMRMIDGLNISLHSANSNEHNNILNALNRHDRIKLTRDICRYFPKKVRACVNLVKGGIDSKQKLMDMIYNLDIIGVQSIKINELCHSNEYISFEKIMDYKLKSPYSHGCYTRVLEDYFPYIKIELKRSCFITESTLSASLTDLIKVVLNKWFIKPLKNKFCVIYEDGTIQKNWITKESLL